MNLAFRGWEAPVAMLALGEVHTGLLQNSISVSAARASQLLALVLGERVRQATRPIPYAVSPDRLTGVDCRLPAASQARVRVVGTVLSRAAITAGHVLQGSTFTRVVTSAAGRRLPWSHYMSQPGVLEIVGKADQEDLASGFTETRPVQPNLDLGAISDRLMDEVQVSRVLDRRPPFRMARTKLRWAATTRKRKPEQGCELHFSIEDSTMRTLTLGIDVDDPAPVVVLCEDLALHDWLLTTLLELIERSRIGDGSRAHVVTRLRPAIDYLLHLWMPAARVDQALLPLWESLEQRPGFTRQWRALVDRIRDQVAVATLAILSTTGTPSSASAATTATTSTEQVIGRAENASSG